MCPQGVVQTQRMASSRGHCSSGMWDSVVMELRCEMVAHLWVHPSLVLFLSVCVYEGTWGHNAFKRQWDTCTFPKLHPGRRWYFSSIDFWELCLLPILLPRLRPSTYFLHSSLQELCTAKSFVFLPDILFIFCLPFNWSVVMSSFRHEFPLSSVFTWMPGSSHHLFPTHLSFLRLLRTPTMYRGGWVCGYK